MSGNNRSHLERHTKEFVEKIYNDLGQDVSSDKVEMIAKSAVDEYTEKYCGDSEDSKETNAESGTE